MKPPLLPSLLALLLPAAALAAPPGEPLPHPGLIFSGSDLDTLRARAARAPYRAFLAAVLGRAAQAPAAGATPNDDRVNAGIAKAAAGACLLGLKTAGAEVVAMSDDERAALGAKALKLLAALDPSTHIAGVGDGDLALAAAERLTPWAIARDLAAGIDDARTAAALGEPCAAALARADDRLSRLAVEARQVWEGRFYPFFNSYNQNHAIKLAAGVALALLALEGDGRALSAPEAEALAWAVDRIWELFGETLLGAEGGYCEGTSYAQYTAVNLRPFAFAWHRRVRGAAWALPGRTVPDLWTSPQWSAFHRWLLAIRLPDGSLPAYDDATPGVIYPFGWAASLPDGGAYVAAWAEARAPYASSGDDLELLAAFDDGAADAALPPDPGHRFLAEAGTAVLRTGWGASDTYLLLLAEHGPSAAFTFNGVGRRMDGTGGHEHSDPLALLLHAHGVPLLLDGGYMGWEDHGLVKQPSHHTMLLVDGKGPSEPTLYVPEFDFDEEGRLVILEDRDGGWIAGADAEAFLTDGRDLGAAALARATARYAVEVRPADLARRVTLHGGRWIGVLDELADAADGSERTLTALWQGNAGGTTGGTFVRLADGGRWARAEASLEVHAVSTQAVTLADREDRHDAGGWTLKTHRALEVSTRGARTSQATVVTSAPAGGPLPVVRAAGGAALAVEGDGFAGTVAFGPSIGVGLAGGLRLEAQAASMEAERTAESTFLAGRDVARASLGDVSVEAEPAVDLALVVDARGVRGRLLQPGPERARLTLRGVPGPGRRTTGLCVARREGGALVLETAPVRDFELDTSAGTDNSAPIAWGAGDPARATAPGTFALSAPEACDADGDALAWAWRLVSTPEGSRAALEGPLLRLDLPGLYALDASADDGRARSEPVRVLVEAVAAPPPPSDDTGCGCRSGPGAGLAALLLCAARRRRARNRNHGFHSDGRRAAR